MKKIFNLAVAMSVIASSLFFASCGEDDEEEEPKQEQNTNNNDNQNQNTKKPVGDPSITVAVAKGESYQISNAKVGVYGQDLFIEDVTESTITVKLSGSTIKDSKITIGTGNNPSYAIFIDDDFTVKAASQNEAIEKAEAVLFICPEAGKLASGTTAKDDKISGVAGATTFQKME